jgi:hypothetical protein
VPNVPVLPNKRHPQHLSFTPRRINGGVFLFLKIATFDILKHMSKKEISGGAAHKMPADLKKVLIADKIALAKWEDITPLARNEWICWVESVKSPEKRHEHIKRTASQLKEGKRRPCCWIGCTHRKDKPLSPSQKFILSKLTKKK